MEIVEIVCLRSTQTRDVKVAQSALETIGFKTIAEGDAVDAYWIEMEVPEKFLDMKLGETKDTFLIGKEYNDDVKLLGVEVMKHRRESEKKGTKGTRQEEIRGEYSIGELRRFAQTTIDERMKFCREYKKDEPFDRCVCESVERYIRLFKDSPMKGDKHLTKLRLSTIRKLFDEMKRDGKIKCPDVEIDKNSESSS